ncbi:ATP-dependent RNA helicase tdrd9, partial [Perkinsus olseni]
QPAERSNAGGDSSSASGEGSRPPRPRTGQTMPRMSDEMVKQLFKNADLAVTEYQDTQKAIMAERDLEFDRIIYTSARNMRSLVDENGVPYRRRDPHL